MQSFTTHGPLLMATSAFRSGITYQIRACLDQLLIVMRSLLIVCDHVRSKERLIGINRPIAINLHYSAAAAGWCSEYQMSLALLGRLQTEHGESGKVGSG